MAESLAKFSAGGTVMCAAMVRRPTLAALPALEDRFVGRDELDTDA
jgi:hypothetical protein